MMAQSGGIGMRVRQLIQRIAVAWDYVAFPLRRLMMAARCATTSTHHLLGNIDTQDRNLTSTSKSCSARAQRGRYFPDWSSPATGSRGPLGDDIGTMTKPMIKNNPSLEARERVYNRRRCMEAQLNAEIATFLDGAVSASDCNNRLIEIREKYISSPNEFELH